MMTGPISPLTAPDDGLTTARPAGPHRFPCQGDRLVTWVSDRTGVDDVIADGTVVARELRADFGPCGNVLASPGAARRELLGPLGVMLQDVFALPRLPGALVQWTPPDGRGFTTTLTWVCPRGSEPERSGSRLHLGPSPDGEIHTVFRVEPEPSAWSIEAQDGAWAFRAQVEVPAGETLNWMVGAAPRQTVAEAAAGAPDRLGPQEAMQAGWLRELAKEHLRTRTGIHEIDSALEWAKARASGHDLPSLPRLLAQLGAGLMTEARATLDALAASRSDDFGAGLGEYLMWSGEHGAPARYRKHLQAWITAGAPGQMGDLRLIEALEGLGYPEESAAVQALPPRSDPPAPESGAGRMVLPVLGQTEGHQPPGPHPSPTPEASWLRFREWTAICASGAISASRDRAADPAYALIRVLLDELLQVSAEASLGRIRLAPALPEHLASFQVEGIRVGKGGIDFRVDKEGNLHRYLFQPTSGAMPVNLTFEPSLLGQALVDARVDGAPAELDWGEQGKRITPRLQLPVDGERTVELQVRQDETD
jgi:hypothetical protein